MVTVGLIFATCALTGGCLSGLVASLTGEDVSRDVLANGLPATGKVLEIWETGVRINDNPVVGFLLEVHADGMEPYQAEIRALVSILWVPQIQPGAELPIMIDPAQPTRVALDLRARARSTQAVAPPGEAEPQQPMHDLPELVIDGPEDPFLWLEEIDSPRALTWVREHSAATVAELTSVPEFDAIHQRLLEISSARDRIPMPLLLGSWIYNFWQDEEHVRGIWRRTTYDQYRQPSPSWETVLDLDALATAEDTPWVWKGATCLERRCMIALSRGGGDTVVQREFDTARRQFVAGGFTAPAAKSALSWLDSDTLLLATDWGTDDSLTVAGYPRTLKRWRRGTPLSAAIPLLTCSRDEVAVRPWTIENGDLRYHLVQRQLSTWRYHILLLLGQRLVRLDIPEDGLVEGVFKDHLLLRLQSEWTTDDGMVFAAGSLLAVNLDPLLRGEGTAGAVEALFAPSSEAVLGAVSWTRDELLVTVLDNVRARLWRHRCSSRSWSRHELPLPGMGSIQVIATGSQRVWFFTYHDFLTPTTLYVVADGEAQAIRSLPSFFDAGGMRTLQHHAISKDGTRVPYFVVLPARLRADGKNPTLLFGYGAVGRPLVPDYTALGGNAWLERGGVWVGANTRGGGEFGPFWHQAAVRERRHKAIEDFIAVAEDLVRKRITSPPHLGIKGGSGGGLLVTAAMTMQPELFGAVVASAPVLDMKRYPKLLAGSSWLEELGDPEDPEQWAVIRTRLSRGHCSSACVRACVFAGSGGRRREPVFGPCRSAL
jgi:prolyl oligopeptidase